MLTPRSDWSCVLPPTISLLECVFVIFHSFSLWRTSLWAHENLAIYIVTTHISFHNQPPTTQENQLACRPVILCCYGYFVCMRFLCMFYLPLWMKQVAYQSIVRLSYVDKLIDQVSLAFRDKYKDDLVHGLLRMVNFSDEFHVCNASSITSSKSI